MNDAEAMFFQQADGKDIAFNRGNASLMIDTEYPILFVEGEPDKEMIMTFFRYFHDNQVQIGCGKEGVKKCVEDAIKLSGNKEIYRGLVDSDIEPFLPPSNDYDYEDCLFYTDTRDMETLLWSTDKDLFRKLLLKGGFRKEIKYKKGEDKTQNRLFTKLVQAAYKLGVIRLIIESSDYYTRRLGIKVNEVTDEKGNLLPGYTSPYWFYYPDRMEIDISELIEKHLCRTPSARRVRYEIENTYDREYKRRIDLKWSIIRGHDFSRILRITLNDWRYIRWKNDDDFESTLHQLYNDNLVHETNVGKEINNWIDSILSATA